MHINKPLAASNQQSNTWGDREKREYYPLTNGTKIRIKLRFGSTAIARLRLYVSVVC